MARQGKVFTDDQLQRILNLLSATEMTIAEIAERMQNALTDRKNVKAALNSILNRKAVQP